MIFLLIVFLGISNFYAQGSNTKNDFDFWLGDWKVEWTDQTGQAQSGTNSIQKILNGKVIEENFSAGSFTGKSVTLFDSTNNIWKQTWVDNNGGYMTFTGGMEKDKMLLYWNTIDKNGKPVKFRMIFSDIQKDNIKWDWEKSTDDGISWTLAWQLNYKRK